MSMPQSDEVCEGCHFGERASSREIEDEGVCYVSGSPEHMRAVAVMEPAAFCSSDRAGEVLFLVGEADAR